MPTSTISNTSPLSVGENNQYTLRIVFVLSGYEVTSTIRSVPSVRELNQLITLLQPQPQEQNNNNNNNYDGTIPVHNNNEENSRNSPYFILTEDAKHIPLFNEVTITNEMRNRKQQQQQQPDEEDVLRQIYSSTRSNITLFVYDLKYKGSITPTTATTTTTIRNDSNDVLLDMSNDANNKNNNSTNELNQLQRLCVTETDNILQKCLSIAQKQQVQSQSIDIFCTWIQDCLMELHERVEDLSSEIDYDSSMLSNIKEIEDLQNQLRETVVHTASDQTLLDYLPALSSPSLKDSVQLVLGKLQLAEQCMATVKPQIEDFERNDDLIERMSIHEQTDSCLEGIRNIVKDQNELLCEYQDLVAQIQASDNSSGDYQPLEESWIDMNESPFSSIELRNRLSEGNYLSRAKANYRTILRFYEQCERSDGTFQQNLITKINDLYYDLYKRDICDIVEQLDRLDLADAKHFTKMVAVAKNLKRFYQMALEEMQRRTQYTSSVNRAVTDTNQLLDLLCDEETNKRDSFQNKMKRERDVSDDICNIIASIFPQLKENVRRLQLQIFDNSSEEETLYDTDTNSMTRKDDEDYDDDEYVSFVDTDSESDLESLDDASPAVMLDLWISKTEEIENKNLRIRQLEQSLSLYTSDSSHDSTSDLLKRKDDEVSKLQEELNQLSEANVSLQDQVDELTKAKETLTSISNVLREKWENLKKQCDTGAENNEQLVAQIDDLKKKEEQFRMALEEKQEMIAQRNKVIEEKNETYLRQGKKISELSEEATQLRSRIEALEDHRSNLQSALEKERRVRETMEQDLEEHRKQITLLSEENKQTIKSKEELIQSQELVSQDLTSQIQHMIETIEGLTKEKVSMETAVSELQRNLSCSSKELALMKMEMDKCLLDLNKERSAAGERQLELEQTKKKLSDLQAENELKEKQIADLKSTHDQQQKALLVQVDTMTQHITKLEDQLSQNEQELAISQSSSDDEINTLSEQLNKTRQELEASYTQLNSFKKEANEQQEKLVSDIERFQNQIHELQSQVSNRDLQITELTSKINSNESKVSEGLQEAIKNLMKKHTDLEQEKATLQSSINQMRQDQDMVQRLHEEKIANLYETLSAQEEANHLILQEFDALQKKHNDLVLERNNASSILRQEKLTMDKQLKELQGLLDRQAEHLKQLSIDKETEKEAVRREVTKAFEKKIKLIQAQFDLVAKQDKTALEQENSELKSRLETLLVETNSIIESREQLVKENERLNKYKTEAKPLLDRVVGLVSQKQVENSELNAALTEHQDKLRRALSKSSELTTVLMNLATYMALPELEAKLRNEDEPVCSQDFHPLFLALGNQIPITENHVSAPSDVLRDVKIDNFDEGDNVLFIKNVHGVWEALCKQSHYYLSPDAVREFSRNTSYDQLLFIQAKVLCVEEQVASRSRSLDDPFRFIPTGTTYYLVHILLNENI